MSDLRKYRNNIVAHNFNIDGQSFFSNFEKKKYEYKVPGSLNEQLFLIKILEKICSNIYFEFETILQDTEFHQKNNGRRHLLNREGLHLVFQNQISLKHL